ncbi:MAG: hypothetical protein IPJ65_30880 [Archangiaceae bacterium]|nr:hypothetical protein [Archangiaceae bacterium]
MIGLVLFALAATPNPYLAQAKVLHQGLEFEKCLKRLDQAGRWQSTTAELAQVELYFGLCAFGLGKAKDAAEHFEMGLKLDPALELPPLVGPKVTAMFERAKEKLAGAPAVEAKPEPTPTPPPAAVEEPKAPPVVAVEPAPVVAPQRPVRLAAPLVLVGVGAVSAAVAAYFGVTAQSLARQAKEPTAFQSDALAWSSQAKTDALLCNVLWAVAGAAVIAAVITLIAQN